MGGFSAESEFGNGRSVEFLDRSGQIWRGHWGLGQISQTHAGVREFSRGSGFGNECWVRPKAGSLDGSGEVVRI
jgi:hypothetical protein